MPSAPAAACRAPSACGCSPGVFTEPGEPVRVSAGRRRLSHSARPGLVQAAVQVGPLVVDPGGKNGIVRNDLDRQRRSAICLLPDGLTVIVLVDGGLSLHELGEVLASPEVDGGFGCDRALNLDGGPSTQ